MMKRKIFPVVFVGIAVVFVGTSCLTGVEKTTPNDAIKSAPISIKHEFNDYAPETVELWQNGKMVFSYTAPDIHYPRLGVFCPVDAPTHNHWRFTHGFFDKNKTLPDYLIDLKGNGDRRYFLIAEWSGGNYGYFMTVIDVKDNFKKLIRFEAAEIIDLKYPNSRLEFP